MSSEVDPPAEDAVILAATRLACVPEVMMTPGPLQSRTARAEAHFEHRPARPHRERPRTAFRAFRLPKTIAAAFVRRGIHEMPEVRYLLGKAVHQGTRRRNGRCTSFERKRVATPAGKIPEGPSFVRGLCHVGIKYRGPVPKCMRHTDHQVHGTRAGHRRVQATEEKNNAKADMKPAVANCLTAAGKGPPGSEPRRCGK